MKKATSPQPQPSTSQLSKNEGVDLISSSAPKAEEEEIPILRSVSLPELRDLHRKCIYPNVPPFTYRPEPKFRPAKQPPIIDFRKYPIKVLNKPRVGKRLLVFEMEHILCDVMGYPWENDPEIKRPHYDEMFKELYKHYDIILWSVDGPVQMRVMLRQLKILQDKNFKVLCCMDNSHIILYDIPNIGFKPVKALQIIWHHFTQYDDTNTILVDYNEYNAYFNRANLMKVAKYFRNSQSSSDIYLRNVKSFLLWVASNAKRNVTKYRFYDYVGWF